MDILLPDFMGLEPPRCPLARRRANFLPDVNRAARRGIIPPGVSRAIRRNIRFGNFIRAGTLHLIQDLRETAIGKLCVVWATFVTLYVCFVHHKVYEGWVATTPLECGLLWGPRLF
ncbi:hypothetical protein CspeluHIS016_0902850 [Cutaneotrichosporon spelunceum]|uniref:Uncharacterized protein n=1 Tax=Cutaneotrichosporon spelunceum TaxID=1672016 RepID=A0AAD3YFD3_9TREE|nr:hypothetical protein CspeluHIS016_0902850 [Cutaneotrichosporon spelunceum]